MVIKTICRFCLVIFMFIIIHFLPHSSHPPSASYLFLTIAFFHPSPSLSSTSSFFHPIPFSSTIARLYLPPRPSRTTLLFRQRSRSLKSAAGALVRPRTLFVGALAGLTRAFEPVAADYCQCLNDGYRTFTSSFVASLCPYYLLFPLPFLFFVFMHPRIRVLT